MFLVSDETKTAEMSKLHAMCSEKHFESKGFSAKKNNISTLFADFEWKNSRLWPNFSTKVSKLISMCPVGLFEKSFLGRSCNFKSTYVFSEEKLNFKCPGLSRRLFRCPAEHSGRQFSRRSKNFLFFWALNENLSGFWQDEFDRVAKTAVHVIREALGIKWLFQIESTSNRFPET